MVCGRNGKEWSKNIFKKKKKKKKKNHTATGIPSHKGKQYGNQRTGYLKGKSRNLIRNSRGIFAKFGASSFSDSRVIPKFDMLT